MDLILPKKTLAKLVSRCVGVADKKSAMPALANLLLAADGGTLRVSATDLYQSVTGAADADVTYGGSIAVPAKDLFERVKAMPDGPVQILTNDACALTLKAVGSPRRYTVHGIPGSEFPKLPTPKPDAPSFALAPALLAQLMDSTVFSVSRDETRPHVNSLRFENRGDVLIAVSTDGHRLSKMEVAIAGLGKHHVSMLIPLAAVTSLRKLVEEAAADKDTGEIVVIASDPNAFFVVGGATFSVKLVDAQFPPYQQVIPKSSDHQALVPRTAFADALRAIKISAADRTGILAMTMAPGMLRLSAKSPESGEGYDEMAVDYAGREVTIGFNADYLLDTLSVIEGDEVLLGLSGELDPMVVRPTGEADGQSYLAVVMPARI